MVATKKKRKPGMPSKIFVGSYEFAMRFVPINDERLTGDDGDNDNNGICITEEGNRGVYLSAAMEPRLLLEVVTHEITHAINWAYDVDVEGEPIEEEELTRKHGVAWAAFYLDNPRYLPWLQDLLARIRREQRRSDDRESDEPRQETPSDTRHADQARGEVGPPPVGGPVRGGEAS